MGSFGLRPKLWLFSIIHFLMGLGYCFGLDSANALLISRIGTAPLFVTYCAAAIMAIVASALFYWGTRRLPRAPLVYLTYGLAGLAIFSAWILIAQQPESPPLYIGIRAGFYAIFVVTTLAFWLFVSDLFNNFEARRYFSFLLAAGIFGELIGGWLVSIYATRLGTVNLMLGWGSSLWLCLVLLNIARHVAPHIFHRTQKPQASMPAVGRPPLTSQLTVCIFLFWLGYSFLADGTDFLFNSMAVKNIPDVDLLTAFFGKVTIYASLVVLIYHALIARRLSAHLGVDRTMFIIPALIVAALGGYAWHPSLLSIAMAQGIIFYFVDYAMVGLLQPALTVYPLNQRGPIRVYTEGLGRPLGALVLLLVSVLALRFAYEKPLLPILLWSALGFLALPFWFHRVYVRHLLHALRTADREHLVNVVQALGEPNKTPAVKPLLALLEHTVDLQLRQNIVLSLAQIQSMEAFQKILSLFVVHDESMQRTVLQALSSYKNYEATFALFRIMKSREMVSFEIRMNATLCLTRLTGKKIIPFLMESLQDQDPRIVANAIESIGVLRDRNAVRLLKPYLDHAHHRIRVNAAIALHPFRATRKAAIGSIHALYTSDIPEVRRAAIYAIGTLRLVMYRPALRELLRSTDDHHLRLFVVVALAQMGDAEFCPSMIQLLLSADSTFALDAAKRLGRIPQKSRFLLFEHLEHIDAAQRAHIYALLKDTHLDFSSEYQMLQAFKVVPVPVTL